MAKKIENKDLDLKLLCKMLFDRMGFCTHYEMQLRTKSYIKSYKTHDISDIDVYGYKFNSDLSFYSIGSECKSGESGALEELFKFLGIMDYYGLDRGYLIKTRIHQNARQVALKNKIRCFTESEIRQILLGYGLDVDKVVSVENAKFYKRKKYCDQLKLKNEKLVDYITLDYWNRENWKNIHNIIHLLGVPIQTELFASSGIKPTEKFVYYLTLELFSVALLRNISEAMILNYSDIESSMVNSLYGGAESLNERRRIHDFVSQVTQSEAKLEPEWQSNLITISTRFSHSTYAASKIPNMVQELLENSFYDTTIKINPEMLKKFPDLTRKFTQDLMQFLTISCSLDKSIFEDFMKL